MELIDYLKISQESSDFELLESAKKIHKVKNINLCSIINAKSGKCGENCKYCAQSSYYNTEISEYSLLDKNIILKQALENEKQGAHRFAIVTSGGSLSNNDFDRIIDAIKLLKRETKLEICVSLGKLSVERCIKLKEAGILMYHHNIETCKEFYPIICSTHSYEDRIETILNLKKVGIEICCGGIIGMGESEEQRVKMAYELKLLGIKSIPINILNPIKGTPLEKIKRISISEILRTIALFRIINPEASIRYAAGRISMGEKQWEGFLYGIDSMMVGNYLTINGNDISSDVEKLNSLGYEV